MGRAARRQAPLVFEWSGYEIPDLFPEYVQKHGEAPEFAFFADEDEALVKIRSGFEADITHLCTDTMRKWVDSGIIAPIDSSRLSHWGDVSRRSRPSRESCSTARW